MTRTQLFISFVLWLLTGYLIGRWRGNDERYRLRTRLIVATRLLSLYHPATARYTFVGGPWDGDTQEQTEPPHQELAHPSGHYACDREALCYIWQPE